MPVKIPASLPAVELLRAENIFVMDEHRANTQDIRPLRIVVLNLMPLKIVTETDLLRLLSNTPLQIELDLIVPSGHVSRNTPQEHLEAFYKEFNDIKSQNYDGMIITGAPVEHLDFEQVDYWNELTEIFDWAHTHVTSTMYICWAGVAALYYRYGIPKYMLDKKRFGVFEHRMLGSERNPLFRGFDDVFYVPHSRHCEIRREDVERIDELSLLSYSQESGVHIVMGRGGREFYIMGHSEYAPNTLDNEYRRDISRGLPIEIPQNYYRDNNPDNEPVVRWRSHGNLLFSNWLNYFVYQLTPYDLNHIQ
ncbi:MAG: homoserine O-succinyltransferase [Bacteroidaceae bacterium]|nr:homoserine O-succinyltransferase [Bacteroidaceae bacterium]MBR6749562.1 homoserine O-succinyltransferase [Bacteroidaceae bacterium]